MKMTKPLLSLFLVLSLFGLVAGCGPSDPSNDQTNGQNKNKNNIEDSVQCGNNQKEGNETCDGTALDGKTCADFQNESGVPFTGGTLGCKSDCSGYELKDCVVTPPPTCNNNGVKENGEECDGNEFGSATCASVKGSSNWEGSLTCTQQCTIDSRTCTEKTPPVGSDTCALDTKFFGQIGSNTKVKRSGGTPTKISFSFDAGLSNIKLLFDNFKKDKTNWTEKMVGKKKSYEKMVDITITNAVVTATERGAGFFYVGDRSGGYFVRMATLGGTGIVESNPPKVGDKVNFKINKLMVYQGHTPQIAGIEGYTLVGSDQEVAYSEINDSIPSEDSRFQIVKASGVLKDPKKCGHTYYTLTTPSGKEIVFRSATKDDLSGKCVNFVGPLTIFNNKAQLDTSNFAWYKKSN